MFHEGTQIGPYTLRRKLGRGNFGVVWLAEKRTPLVSTHVALKIPLDDEITLEAVRAEAAIWAQATGHPNVLPIIDADLYDDQIVIVSEYAPDGSLHEWLHRSGGRAPSLQAAVAMVGGILSGLEHLHSRRIIHRDLKPANILLQGDMPRLADFGIARVLKSASMSTLVSGTPQYMAPEAFDGRRFEQSDIWAVGVIAYQMLCGYFPFDGQDMTALMGAILGRDPLPFPPDVPPDVQAAVLRALNKNPAHRYASAAEMRIALQRAASLSAVPHRFAPTLPALPSPAPSVRGYQAFQPTRPAGYFNPNSNPPASTLLDTMTVKPNSSGGNRPRELSPTVAGGGLNPDMFRSKPFLAAILAGMLVLTGTVGAAGWYAVNKARRSFTASPDSPASPLSGNERTTGGVEFLKLDSVSNAQMAFTRAGDKLLTANRVGVLVLWDTATGRELRRIDAHGSMCSGVAITPDGKFGVSAAYGETSGDCEMRFWDLTTGQRLGWAGKLHGPISTIAFVPNSNLVLFANGSDNKVHLFDTAGNSVHTFITEERADSLAVSLDGKLAVWGGINGTVEVWETASRTRRLKLSCSNGGQIHAAAISPDNRFVAAGCPDGRIKLYDLADGREVRRFERHGDRVWNIVFSPDGKRLMSEALEKNLKIWDVGTGSLVKTLERTGFMVSAMTFAPDGKTAVMTSADGLIERWKLD